MKQVTVIFERDEDSWWVASAKEIAGCHTQGRSIAQARQRFVEALGLFVDSPDKVVLVEDIRLPATARRVVDASAEARAEADQRVQRAQASTIEAARTLNRDLELSARDVSELLGLSHQRVQQLLRPSRVRSQPTKHVRKARRATASR